MEQNKVRTYLLYAVGEIALVMIGILLALQVNNWNEKRKEASIAESIMQNLFIDIEEDLANLESLKEMLKARKGHADYLISVIQNPSTEVDSVEVLLALTRVGWILNYTPAFATYNEITNSGRLSLINSADLKKRLADYKSQVADNRRIEESYESGLKEAEYLALSFLPQVPKPNNLYTGLSESISAIDFDLDSMRQNQTFINHLKHISYHTGAEILYKDNLIIPRAEAILEALKQKVEEK